MRTAVKKVIELTFTGASEALDAGRRLLAEYPRLILELKTKSDPVKNTSVMHVFCVSEAAFETMYRLTSEGNDYNSATVFDHMRSKI